jgi:hypothetical protein
MTGETIYFVDHASIRLHAWMHNILYMLTFSAYLFKVSKLKKCLLTNDHREKCFSKQLSLSLSLTSFLQGQGHKKYDQSFFHSYAGIKIKKYFFISHWVIEFSYDMWYLMLWSFQKILKMTGLKLFRTNTLLIITEIYMKTHFNSWLFITIDIYLFAPFVIFRLHKQVCFVFE